MSRSYQKMPIKSHTTCRSERLDKQIWHKRWRTKERIKLASLNLENLDDHLTTDRREVSNPWNMGKDGKHYFSKNKQMLLAKTISNRRGQNPRERSVLKKRLLYKSVGK